MLKVFLEQERQKYRKVLDRLDNARDENDSGSLGRQARKKEVEDEIALIERAFLWMR